MRHFFNSKNKCINWSCYTPVIVINQCLFEKMSAMILMSFVNKTKWLKKVEGMGKWPSYMKLLLILFLMLLWCCTQESLCWLNTIFYKSTLNHWSSSFKVLYQYRKVVVHKMEKFRTIQTVYRAITLTEVVLTFL